MKNFLFKVWAFYYEGFREMTLGRVLWLIILVKLFLMFVVLRIFFFPDFVNTHAEEGQEAQFVGEQLINRLAP